jgi:hypothetical protein
MESNPKAARPNRDKRKINIHKPASEMRIGYRKKQ